MKEFNDINIVECSFEKEILANKKEYFFTFLSDRFEYMTELWKEQFEKEFKKEFEPIWIVSAKGRDLPTKNNFVIVNKKLKKIISESKNENTVYLQDYEDLNVEFSNSKSIKKLISNLVKKQGRVFLVPFTTACLNIVNKKVKIIGPNPKISQKFDSKIEHVKLFEKLNVPRNNSKIYKNINEIRKKTKYPFYISAAYSSGGHESKVIRSEEDLNSFYNSLRDLNKKNSFIVADYIEKIAFSPNVNAIIYGKNKVKIICISEQILRENQYLGNIYPTKMTHHLTKQIEKITTKIGNHLSKIGFRGIFGLDFIIDYENNIFTVDLNPRRQGGYACNVMMLKTFNLIELELKIALNKKIIDLSKIELNIENAWAHSKIKPYQKNMITVDSYKINEFKTPFVKKGTIFKNIFYPKNYLLMEGSAGYIILSGNSHDEVKQKIIEETEATISQNFKKML